MKIIKTSSVILLAKTETEGKFLFGAYKDDGEATGFLSLPEDHGVFLKLLIGQQTIMGANTLKATPTDFPDAGRICVTHHPEKVKPPAIAVNSIQSAVELAKSRAENSGEDKVFVIGGAKLIKEFLDANLLDEIEMTLVYGHRKNVPNPVFLDFNFDRWEILKDSGILVSAASDPGNLKYRFLSLKFKG